MVKKHLQQPHTKKILLALTAATFVSIPFIRYYTRDRSQFTRSLLTNAYVATQKAPNITTALETKKDSLVMQVSRGDSRVSFATLLERPKAEVKDGDIAFHSPNGTIIQYQSIKEGIKEEIVLSRPPGKLTFTSTLTIENAQPALTPEGQIVFLDESGGYQFHIRQPFAKDANGNVTYGIRYRLAGYEQTHRAIERAVNNRLSYIREILGPVRAAPAAVASGMYTLSLELDPVWLNDPKRAYPVTIDPTIVHDTSAEFLAGQQNRIKDTGSGASPVLEAYYQELIKDPYTVGLWHLNETVNDSCSGGQDACDSSDLGNHGVATGTTINTTTQRLGSAARAFNGGTDTVALSNLGVNTASGAYNTVEFWMKWDGTVAKMPFGFTAYDLYMSSAACFGFNTANGDILGTTGGIPVNEWFHVAAVFYNGTPSAWDNKLYINGEERPLSLCLGTASVSRSVTTTANISGWGRNANYKFLGSIDDVRISNIERSAEEIKRSASRRPYAVYTSDLLDLTGGSTVVTAWNPFTWSELGVKTGGGETPYSTTNLVAQWNFNETSGTSANNDAEGTSCGGTPANCDGTLYNFDSTASQDADPDSSWTANNRRWGTGAIQFDGVDSYVSIPDNNVWAFGSGNFSIETWFKPSDAINRAGIWQQGEDAANWNTNTLEVVSNKLRWLIRDASTTILDISSNQNLIPGKWYHAVATRNGSTFTLYLNGTTQTTGTSGTAMPNIAYAVNIGRRWVSGGTVYQFRGVIDSTRVYSRALTVSEILSNYSAGNIEFQTRVGNDTSPDDGSWEAWRPATGETTVDTMESYSPAGCSAVGGSTSDGGRTYIFTNPKTIYKYTGKDQTYTVPSGVTSINVKMWGAGGGGGVAGGWSYGFAGGGGGYTTADLSVTPGQQLTVMVGNGGTFGWYPNMQSNYGGGARSCNTGGDCRYGGQGGGRSAIISGSTELLTAGGGGGGGASRVTNGQAGGAGGGSSGVAGSSYTAACAGGGGTQSAGGAGGTCANANGSAGSQFAGGNPSSNAYGGSGGGGYYGGGGGGYGESNDMGGGGGGSGYIGGTGVSNATTTAGSGASPGNTSDTDWGGAGYGGAAGVFGTPGKVVIAINQSSPSFTCTGSGVAEVLVVAGGGGGGMDMGGGGGGGGVIYHPSYAIAASTPVSVSVGNGGRGGPPGGLYGQNTAHQFTIGAQNGQNSVFGTLTAVGGGAGGSSYFAYTPGASGAAGGSGGGSSGYSDGNTRAGGAGTAGQGFAGGQGGPTQYYSGGGGGAGGVGVSANSRPDGGIGYYSDILGSGYYWGGGGGGAGYSIGGGNGGAGGGGGGAAGATYGGSGINPGESGGGGISGAQTNAYGGDGGAFTGGGGGASSHYNMYNEGGDGGSGIVIVRLSPLTKDTTTKVEQSTSQKITTGRPEIDENTVALWHLDETGGTGAYLKNSSSNVKGIVYYSGADQTYTVPSGATSLNIKLWGGGGGAGYLGGWTYGYDGGGGGYTTGDLSVSAGQTYAVMVGAGGNNGNSGNQNSNYGGGGPNCGGSDCRYGGQGGGRSAIRSGGADLLTAGGGGGGGASLTVAYGMEGGGGGGLSGHLGRYDNSGQTFAGGGTQAAGGAAATGTNYGATAGSQYQGGRPNTPYSYGGSGGGGWYGGGGGAYTANNSMAGGGGGSGYIGGTGISNATTVAAINRVQANAEDPDNGGAGEGGGGISRGYTNGVNGRAVITPNTTINHATPYGPTATTGISGKARSFNGSSDYILIPASPSLDLQTFTIEAWVYAANFNQSGFLFEKTTNGSVNTQYSAFFNGSDTFYFRTHNTAAAEDDLTFTTSSYFKNNQWNHVAATYDGFTKAVYVNGVLANSKAYTQTLATNPNGTAIIGAYGSGTSYFFNGKIDEVRISDKARSQEDVAERYRRGRDIAITTTLSPTDLSGKNTIAFSVAADRPGSYLTATIGESAFANYLPDDNTKVLLHLDEESGSGSFHRDASGNNNNASVVVGSPLYGIGRIGKSRRFGGGGGLTLGSPASLDFGNNGPFTIAGWIKPVALVDYGAFVSKNTSRNSPYSYMTVTMANGRISAYTGAAWVDICPAGTITTGNWQHVAYVFNGTTIYGYANGQLCGSAAFSYTDDSTDTVDIGSWYSPSTQYNFQGFIDEVSISNAVRTADEIRQAAEYETRTHPVMIDFAASLDAGNLIADQNDLSFTVDATAFGLQKKGEKLFDGDKVIVRENYGGTEYIAQGDVTSVDETNGYVTVDGWDAGYSFPASGFTASADVFKWQRESWDITEPLDSQLNAASKLTLRITDGNEGHTVWLDDVKSAGDYLTNPSGSTITSSLGYRYFQYRAVLSSFDESVSPQLTSATLDYESNTPPGTPTLDSPASGATNIGLTPTLLTTSSDAESDSLKYKIELCTNLAMTQNCQTFDQTVSTTGWSSTSYASGAQASFTIQNHLSTGTTYYWRSYAIDQSGSNTWSGTQGTPYSFTLLAGNSFQMQTGYYVGDGADNHAITGLGFQPDLVFIKDDTTNGSDGINWKSSAMSGEVSAVLADSDGDTASDAIQSLDSDGFTLGTDADVNGLNVRYTWIAFSGSDCSNMGTFCVGSYTGNGVNPTTRQVTGFQPDFVGIKRSGATTGVFRTSSMPVNEMNYFDSYAPMTDGDGIASFVYNGFVTGNSSTVNTSANTYWFFAFKNVTDAFTVGSFTGDGLDNKAITVGFQPDVAWVKNSNATVPAISYYNITESSGDYSTGAGDTGNLTGVVKSLDANGFTVGTNAAGNESGQTIYWFAFNGAIAHAPSGTYTIKTGIYTGNGTAQSITGVGFAPDLVMIRDQTNAVHAVYRTKLMKGDVTMYMSSPTTYFAGGITSMDANGFTVGADAKVNGASTTYHYQAFGNAFNPETGTGATDFYIGHFMGNGLDNRSIVRLPFQPDLIGVQRGGAYSLTMRTSAMSGDLSGFLGPYAEAADHIQAINSNGFEVGTNSRINAAAGYYYFFAFKAGSFLKIGNYTGTGSAQDITEPGEHPNLIWTMNTGAYIAAFRPNTLAGDNTLFFDNSAPAAGYITALLANGFSVGSNYRATNYSGDTYRYIVWHVGVAPGTPTLDSPTNGATGTSQKPTLQTTASDADLSYVRYKIQLCTDLAMSQNCQTFDQTATQNGWSGQNTETNSAYTSATQGSYTVQTQLAPLTVYYWRSYAIDPGDSNTWSGTQGTPYSFTTGGGDNIWNINGINLEFLDIN